MVIMNKTYRPVPIRLRDCKPDKLSNLKTLRTGNAPLDKSTLLALEPPIFLLGANGPRSFFVKNNIT